MNCLAVRTAVTSSSGPHTQPIFQPVKLNVLPAELMVSVRSAMPGKVASGRCSPSNTRCSYTSSVTAMRSCSTHSRAMASSSATVNTLPVGLCGRVEQEQPRAVGDERLERVDVRLVGRAASSVTGRSRAPAMAATAV